MSDTTTTVSLKLSDMTLDQLVQLNQGLGHDIERKREQRRHINAIIAQRLAAGERNGVPAAEGQPAGVDAEAPGAVIDLTAG